MIIYSGECDQDTKYTTEISIQVYTERMLHTIDTNKLPINSISDMGHWVSLLNVGLEPTQYEYSMP